MAVVSAIGVENLRSIKKTHPNLRIAPITVLLGKNSVGKSTFARLFPLLRQSAERRKRSPILWFGDFVDFGSIGRAIRVGQSEIVLSFDLTFDATEVATPRAAAPIATLGREVALKNANVRLVLAEEPVNKTGYAKSLEFDVFGGKFRIEMDPSKRMITFIEVNGKKMEVPSADRLIMTSQGDILPRLHFYQKKVQENGSTYFHGTANPWIESVVRVIRDSMHGNTSMSTVRRIASQIPLGTASEIAESLKEIEGPQTWKAVVNNASRCTFTANKLHAMLIAAYSGEIAIKLDEALSTYLAGVRYLKPLRATAERYYRRVDLADSEIDPEGRNLPMFLDSLPFYELQNFREWIKRALDVDAHTSREGDQIMVMARGPNDPAPFNIADMGFGISQVLPIAAQLWSVSQRRGPRSSCSVVVVEQPELHLHPEFQSRLADLFAETVKSEIARRPPSLIIETHSQQLVNRLGQLVEQGKLNPEDVSVLLFESEGESLRSTTIRATSFDKEGVLIDWPYGFFEPEIR